MRWLTNLFRKPRPDPLGELRREPTDDERVAFAIERLEQDCEDALRDGEHVLCGWSNVAYGTRGYTLHVLVQRGLMRCVMEPGPPGEGGRYIYRVTDAGRRRLAEMA